MRSAHLAVLGSLTALVLSQAAVALPNPVTRNDTVDDATITVTIWDAFILGDARSWCTVRIQVGNSDVSFSTGDTVEVKIRESEGAGGVGDDDLWRTIFNVDAAQISGGVDETFDCSADFLDDTGSTSEIYAWAEVVKDNCGTFCLNDRPSTGAIDVAELDDDGMEENDNIGGAKTLPPGSLPGRIAKDADWYVIDATGPMSIDVSALHRPEGGRLDLTLHDSTGNPTGDTGTDAGDRVRLQLANLALGTWYLRVMPRSATDFNFYDLDSTLTDLTTTCTPGEQSSRPCGRCGTEIRSCNGSGEWDPYGTCSSQGVCSPGERVNEVCGNCGNRFTTCDDNCAWVTDPVCSDEGPCIPAATEDQACTGGGTQSRSCQADCTWTEWGTCTAPPLGAACTTDADCGTGLYCALEGGLFPGGYCTQVGCTSDADCAPGHCVTAFGQSWCFAGCPMETECRTQYLCVDVASGKACQPPCRDDLDCWGQTGVCGSDGLCAGGGSSTGDGGDYLGAQGGCGCDAPVGLDPWTAALALLFGLGIFLALSPEELMRRLAVLALAFVLVLGVSPALAEKKVRARPGPKVTLRVKEMPVVDLLRFLADFARLNLVAGDDVKGKVTVDLKNVHWHKAFEAVARSRSLWWELEGNVLVVMSAEARQRELDQALARKDAGEKLAIRKLRLLPVHYARAADLVPQVELLLGDQAKVSVDERTNTLILLSP